MKKLWKLEQLEELKLKYEKEVLQSIEEVFTVLNENYGGESRNVDADLGGYVILIDNEEEIKSIQSEIVKYIKLYLLWMMNIIVVLRKLK